MGDDPRWRPAIRPWYRNRGMNPLLALVGLGAVFVVLAVLMIARGGHDDATPPADRIGKSTTDR